MQTQVTKVEGKAASQVAGGKYHVVVIDLPPGLSEPRAQTSPAVGLTDALNRLERLRRIGSAGYILNTFIYSVDSQGSRMVLR